MKLDDLMNASLDDLADLPAFECPPNGSYNLDLTLNSKKINGKDSIVFDYVVKNCIEQVDPSVKPADVGQKFSVPFQLENETGVGLLKLSAAPLFAHFQIDPKVKGGWKELLAKAKNLTVFGVVNQRPYKNTAGEEKIGASVLNLNVL